MNWIRTLLSKNVNTHGRYRSDIDGLRAVAILVVVFYHAHLGVSGGYVGVDVFFVISGYLITGLIWQDFDAGKFSLLQFWERRVRRILPALTVVVFASIVAGWILYLPSDYEDFGSSVVAQSLLISNFHFFWASPGYFARAAELMPLLHTWSLAVEEQFYVLFPLLLLLLSRTRRDITAKILLVVGLLSLGFSIYCSYTHPLLNFYLLPGRSWELLVGGYLATAKEQRPIGQIPRELVAVAGLTAIFYSAFAYTPATRFPGLAAMLPCLGAGAIIWANGPNLTYVGKLLSLPAVVFVGLISYSLYLWHWPMLAFGRYWNVVPNSDSAEIHAICLLGAGFIFAILSWRYVETPFRKRQLLQSRVQIFSAGAGALAVMILSGFIIEVRHGFPSRFSPEIVAYAEGLKDQGIHGDTDLAAARRAKFIELGRASNTPPARLFVWGDSHAMAILSVMNALCEDHGIRGLAATHSSTPPLVDFEAFGQFSLRRDTIPYNDTIMQFIQAGHFHDVLLAGKWNDYGNRIAAAHQQLLATIHLLKQTGARIWILRQVPTPGLNVPRVLAWNAMCGKDGSRVDFPLDAYRDEATIQNQILEGIASTDATILDPDPYFFDPEHHLIVEKDGRSLYFDDHHLSAVGAMRLRPLFEPIFTGTKGQASLRSSL